MQLSTWCQGYFSDMKSFFTGSRYKALYNVGGTGYIAASFFVAYKREKPQNQHLIGIYYQHQFLLKSCDLHYLVVSRAVQRTVNAVHPSEAGFALDPCTPLFCYNIAKAFQHFGGEKSC